MNLLRTGGKISTMLFSMIGGTLALTVFMGFLLWATTPGPEFVPFATGALGCLSGAILGLFQAQAVGSLVPKNWVPVSALAGALGAPLSIALAFPFLFVVGELGIAIGGIMLGFAFGLAQFTLLRKQYAKTWPWILINSVALGAGFYVALPITSSLNLGFYPPFSPGWTAVGVIAGLTYGFITGLVIAYSKLGERILPVSTQDTLCAA